MTKKLLLKHQDKFLPEHSREIPPNGIVTVGSEISSTVVLTGKSIAPEQFVIVCENAQMTLLCRVDGTSVNGENLAQGSLHNLQLRDIISVGNYTFLIEETKQAEEILSRQTDGEKTAEVETAEAAKKAEIPLAVEKQIEKPQKGLKNVLEDLRAEEKFFFRIETADGEERRAYVEMEDLWLVWTTDGDCVPVFEPAENVRARAQIRKDWSGVVLHPLQAKSIWINDKPLAEPVRLKNGDRLSLLGKEGAKHCSGIKVNFHEPTALLVLDSILPKELPPPISLDKQKKTEINGRDENRADEDGGISGRTSPSAAGKTEKKLIFGYFTFAEIVIMTIGTLITAVVIFLILEFF